MDRVCDFCASLSSDHLHTWQIPSDIEPGVDLRPVLDVEGLRTTDCDVCDAFKNAVPYGFSETTIRVSYFHEEEGNLFRGQLCLSDHGVPIWVLHETVHAAEKPPTYTSFDVLKQKVLACLAHPEDEDHFIGKPESLPTSQGFRVIDCSSSTIVPAPINC